MYWKGRVMNPIGFGMSVPDAALPPRNAMVKSINIVMGVRYDRVGVVLFGRPSKRL